MAVKVVPATLKGSIHKAGALKEILKKGLPVKFEGRNYLISHLKANSFGSSEIALHAMQVPGEKNPFVVKRRSKEFSFREIRPDGNEGHIGGLEYKFYNDKAFSGEHYAKITNLWVGGFKDKLQGKGVGSHLYSLFERLAREHGCTQIVAEATPGRAIDFYIKQGFKGKPPHPGALIRSWSMTKKL